MTSRFSWGARVYRAVQRLLPVEFRGDFGEAMAADLAGRRDRGFTFWCREIASVLKAAVREHADALRQDLTYALRMMRRTPGFTALAVAMLALGTGVNTAMFSIIDAVLLRSPFPDPAQLVLVKVRTDDALTATVPERAYRDLLNAPGPLVAVGAFSGGSHVLTGRGDPLNVDDIECVASELFDVLRTPPLLGRTFSTTEDRPAAAPTIVLSYDFWRRLGGSADLLGTAITINRTPVTVIGVMPKGFAGPLARADVQGWLPRDRPVQSAENAGCRRGAVNVVARLPPGLAVEAAASALPGFGLVPLESPIMDDVRTPFTVLMIAMICVLLIACLNVGGLQMERTLARRREMALRLALGASWGRLVRQTLTENVLLALAGASAGIAAAELTLRPLVSMLPSNVPYMDQIAVNPRVLAVTIGAAAVAGVCAGLLPIAQMRHVNPAHDLADTTRATERRGSWGRRGLVVAEIAVSLVVLIAAALMVQTYLTLLPTRPGFDPTHKLVMAVRLPEAAPDANEQFFKELLRQVRAAPAIRDADGSTYVPMSGNTAVAMIKIGETTTRVLTNYTTPGFLAFMKVPVVAGRMFSPDDSRGSPPVMIVNKTLATRIRADGQVIGQTLLVKSESGPAAAAPVERTIVGVIADMRSSGIDTRARSEAYVPYAQNPVAALHIVAEPTRGRDAEAAIAMRAAVRALGPDLAVDPPRSMDTLLRQRLGATPFAAWLLGAIAGLAVALAAIGLMATIGWWVRQRRRELGVRIALGATRGSVTALVVRQGMTLAVVGVGLGCAAAVGLTRYLAGWIYGVTPLDTATFAGCAALMLLCAACAVYSPVRKATSIDPLAALRAE